MQAKMSEKIAKVLEANAKYTEALERENTRLRDKIASFEEKEKQAEISPIISQVEKIIGELDNETKEKVANSREILALVDKLSKDQLLEPMGEVSHEKVASDSTHLSPDQRFAAWATGQSDKY